ncbi:MAG: hypothetical protein WC197_06770 [Candidatus Gastranaerophilaceae bacterium]|jgi:hypothetical protein
MKLQIKKSGGLPYARKEPYEYDGTTYESDIKDGDVVKILDSGETEIGTFGEQTVFKIKTRNGDKKLSFNQATINVLVQELGEETETWINKDVKVLMLKKLIAGKKAIVPYLVTDEWKLDEYGELYKGEKKEDDNQGVNIPF